MGPLLVGHDWGGSVAWATAMNHPEMVDRHFFRHFLHDANPAYTPEEIERYVEAWSQPDAATGMINYYRSSVRQSAEESRGGLFGRPRRRRWSSGGSAITT